MELILEDHLLIPGELFDGDVHLLLRLDAESAAAALALPTPRPATSTEPEDAAAAALALPAPPPAAFADTGRLEPDAEEAGAAVTLVVSSPSLGSVSTST